MAAVGVVVRDGVERERSVIRLKAEFWGKGWNFFPLRGAIILDDNFYTK